jgi:hypothetical protein
MINDAVVLIVNRWIQTICNRVKAEWGSKQGLSGMQKDINGFVLPFVMNEIVGVIKASGYGAYIGEWGSGHSLDENNPYLNAYKGTDAWNSARNSNGNEFIGRAKGDKIYRPNGDIEESSGKAEGMRLEHKLSSGYPAYKAFPAMHIIRQEITFAIPQIKAEIQTAIQKEIRIQLLEGVR